MKKINAYKKHIVIIRTNGNYLDYKTYNCQEIGLGIALARRGYKISVVLSGKEYAHHNLSLKDVSIDVYYLKCRKINQSLFYFIGLNKFLISLNAELIQIHDLGITMTYYIAKWAKNNKIPVVLIQGNYRVTQKFIFKQLEEIYNITFGKKTLKLVDGIGCKTNRARTFINKYSKRKVYSTPIGLDISRFTESFENESKDRYFNNRNKTLLYVGSIESRRNPIFLVDILNNLPSNYKMLVVGSGSLEESMRRTVFEKGMQDRCEFLGVLDQKQLSSIYSGADLFLLASNYEIFGMVILEAMYFSLPVCTTLTAGSEMIINSGLNGIVISKLDAKLWADKIKQIIESPITHNKMRKSAHNHIIEHFIWDKAVNNFIKLYNGCLNI